MFCRSLFVPLYLFLTIVLSVLLRYADSDYPFGIFKLFLDIKEINLDIALRYHFHPLLKQSPLSIVLPVIFSSIMVYPLIFYGLI